MKKYLAIALLVSLSNVYAADGAEADVKNVSEEEAATLDQSVPQGWKDRVRENPYAALGGGLTAAALALRTSQDPQTVGSAVLVGTVAGMATKELVEYFAPGTLPAVDTVKGKVANLGLGAAGPVLAPAFPGLYNIVAGVINNGTRALSRR